MRGWAAWVDLEIKIQQSIATDETSRDETGAGSGDLEDKPYVRLCISKVESQQCEKQLRGATLRAVRGGSHFTVNARMTE